MSTSLTRLFPTPSFFTIPTVGLDFSDSTLRFVRLKESRHGLLPEKFAEIAIPHGCMHDGRIVDALRFTTFLSGVKKDHKLHYLRIAIPESQVYSFTLPVDIAAANDIRSAIELVLEDNIPLKATETIFDYHVMSNDEKVAMVQVVAVSEAISRSYFDAFTSAGLIPVSFELDGQAVARAVLAPRDTGSYMVVDFGAHRTGITIVTNGTAVYTSTLDFGGVALIDALVKELNITPEEAVRLKRTYGLSATGEHKNIFSILVNGISILKDEINRRYIYWHEKKNQLGAFPPIETVYLCGGHSNLRGLSDYLSVTLKLNVIQVNPWINCVSFEEDIPQLQYEESMSYVTAIGLALADHLYL